MELLHTLMSYLPKLSYELPWIGWLDLTPYVWAVLVYLLLTMVFRILQTFVLVQLRKLFAHTKTDIDDVVISAIVDIRPFVYRVVTLFVVLQLFTVPAWLLKIATAITLFAVVWQGIVVISRLVSFATSRWLEKDEDGDGKVDPNSAMMSNLMNLIARVLLWVFGVIFILSNIGIEVTSLLAGLGIGGIAIAFALQGVLTDLFASFSLYFDKPFRIGDVITVGADTGTVEKIGIKTTRIRTLQGEELVVSNTELTTTRVQNFKKLEERRGAIQFGVTYETPFEKVKGINDTVADIFAGIDGGRLDRTFFTTFGDSALIFDVVFYAESAAYADFLAVQQEFNFALMERFATDGIEFAYPTQLVYHKAV